MTCGYIDFTGCRLVRAVMLIVIGVLSAACTEDTVVERSGMALLHVQMQIDAKVMTPRGPEDGVVAEVPSEDDMRMRLIRVGSPYGHEWESIADYPSDELLSPGDYTVEFFNEEDITEGFDRACFYGSKGVRLSDGDEAGCDVVCALANAMVDVDFTHEAVSSFAGIKAVVHVSGGDYFTYLSSEMRPLYLRPGKLSVDLGLTMADGTELLCNVCRDIDVKACNYYQISIDCVDTSEEPVIKAVFDSRFGIDDIEIRIDRELLSSAVPVLEPHGFVSGDALVITEGDRAGMPVGIGISGKSSDGIIMTTVSPSLVEAGWPQEVDLVSASDEVIDRMSDLGLSIDRGADGAVRYLDFSEVIPALRIISGKTRSEFTLRGVNTLGKVSDPVCLAVELSAVDFTLLDVPDIEFCDEELDIKVSSTSLTLDENLAVEILDNRDRWNPVEISNVESLGAGQYRIGMKLPVSMSAHETLRVLYCGNEVGRFTTRRKVPDYSVRIDAFATSVHIKIDAADADIAGKIAENLKVFVNGGRVDAVVRYPEAAMVIAGVLRPDTEYTLRTSVLSDATPADFTSEVKFTTERDIQLPNGDFEDQEQTISYSDMPSGGRYSQNIVDIFNQQNYRSFSVSTPRKWATTNDKTFCRGASNHNTWYMCPSVNAVSDCASGVSAMKIQSVAWDTDGARIPDYRQSGLPYTHYSKNVPDITHRSAGKLFIGEYSFDASTLSERYNEGVEFASRPSALNGYYRYIPVYSNPADRGLVRVEVIGVVNGAEIVVAHGSMLLAPVTGYTTFSLPLKYEKFGVKAVRIKVMFASGSDVGSIEYESENVVTLDDMPSATSLGSTLWIDALTLSY